MSRSRRRRFALFSALLVLAGLELAARLLQPWLVRTQPSFYYRQVLSALVQESPVLIWQGIPGAHAELANPLGQKIPYRLNAQGWRDEEFVPFGKSLNGLVLGDSFSFGLGVGAERRYTELLEAQVPGLNLWNLGVMGYAPDQYLLLAMRWLPPVPWSFLVVQLSNNDLADVAGHEWVSPHSTTGIPAALRPPRGHSFFSSFSEAWNVFAYFVLLGREQRPADARLEDGLKRLGFSLRETLRLARERGIPAIVLMASDWGEPAYGADWAKRYRDAVSFVAKDFGAVLLEVAPVPLLPFPDLHWNEEGHRAVAAKLMPVVRQALAARAGAAAKSAK